LLHIEHFHFVWIGSYSNWSDRVCIGSSRSIHLSSLDWRSKDTSHCHSSSSESWTSHRFDIKILNFCFLRTKEKEKEVEIIQETTFLLIHNNFKKEFEFLLSFVLEELSFSNNLLTRIILVEIILFILDKNVQHVFDSSHLNEIIARLTNIIYCILWWTLLFVSFGSSSSSISFLL